MKTTLREVDKSEYSQLSSYTKDDISGGECLNEEFTQEQMADPPDVYQFCTAGLGG
jgi:hypothetical protein